MRLSCNMQTPCRWLKVLLCKTMPALLFVSLFSLNHQLQAQTKEVYPFYHPCQAEDGLWGYVDNDNEWQVRPQYTALLYETNGGMYPVSVNGKWGFVGVSGEPLTEVVYDAAVCEIDYERNGYQVNYAALRRKGKWAFINVQGVFVTEFKYDEVLILNGKYVIRVKGSNGKMQTGYLNANGEEVWNK